MFYDLVGHVGEYTIRRPSTSVKTKQMNLQHLMMIMLVKHNRYLINDGYRHTKQFTSSKKTGEKRRIFWGRNIFRVWKRSCFTN
ncbi:unnamed protein product [Haemonchus placei]|uniref:Uncharacterized protein n=1 Tax=Haemonchus placei TaxID=6290 RepID=A0A3P7X4I8_HAEPC|nr:unnamed protein product [Haemonchus placei]